MDVGFEPEAGYDDGFGDIVDSLHFVDRHVHEGQVGTQSVFGVDEVVGEVDGAVQEVVAGPVLG